MMSNIRIDAELNRLEYDAITSLTVYSSSRNLVEILGIEMVCIIENRVF